MPDDPIGNAPETPGTPAEADSGLQAPESQEPGEQVQKPTYEELQAMYEKSDKRNRDKDSFITRLQMENTGLRRNVYEQTPVQEPYVADPDDDDETKVLTKKEVASMIHSAVDTTFKTVSQRRMIDDAANTTLAAREDFYKKYPDMREPENLARIDGVLRSKFGIHTLEQLVARQAFNNDVDELLEDVRLIAFKNELSASKPVSKQKPPVIAPVGGGNSAGGSPAIHTPPAQARHSSNPFDAAEQAFLSGK